MNKIFKVIYSKTRHCYVVVSELAKNQGKSEKSKYGMKRHNRFYRLAAIAALIISVGSLLYPMQAEAITDLSTNDYFTAYDKNYFDKEGKKSEDWKNVKPSNTDQDEENVGAKGTGAIAAGIFAQAGQQTVTIGDRNAGMSMGSVFVGEYKGYNNPSGNQPQGLGNNYVTSVGFMSNATKYGTIAIGAGASAEGEDNSVTLGDKDPSGTLVSSLPDPENLKINGASVSLGYSAQSKHGNIAIGAYSDATTDLSADTSDKAKSYLTENNATSYVSVGSKDVQRRISNVADGAADSDVATVGQLKKLSDKAGVYNEGWGINIADENDPKTGAVTKKNVIILKHNLGTGYNDDEAKGMIIGGLVEDRDPAKQYGAADANSVIVGAGKALASGKSSVVVGGLDNVASGATSVVVGGDNNNAAGNQSAVFGGRDNTAAGIASTAGGGIMNVANGQQAVALGGAYNYALGTSSTAIGGTGGNGMYGYSTSVNGNYSVSLAGGSTGTDALNGLAAGNQSVVTTANGTAVGYQATTDKEGTIAFGHDAGDVSGYAVTWKKRTDGKTNADHTTNDYTQVPDSVTPTTYKDAYYNRLVKVADGQDAHDVVVMEQLTNATNDLTKDLSVNAGWGINVADEKDTTGKVTKNVISLNRNLGTNYGNPWKGEGKVTFEAGGENSMILGGAASILFNNEEDNVKAGAYGKDSVLVGGFNNLIDKNDDDTYKIQTGEDAVIVGGDTNKVTGLRSVIIGGYQNNVSGGHSVVVGGELNETDGGGAGVFGGQSNKASGAYSSVLGGDHNEADGDSSSAIGGTTNTASGRYATTLGGINNNAKGNESVVVGGVQNVAIGEDSTVNGGAQNTSYGSSSYAAGGMKNMAFGNASVALGGQDSSVNGKFSTGIAGGSTGENAIFTLAAGYQSVVADSGVEWRPITQDEADKINQGIKSWPGYSGVMDLGEDSSVKVLDRISTAVGYQSTADAPGVIAFGHDKGDVASVAKKWKQKATMEVDDNYSVKYYDANHKEISADDYNKLVNSDGTLNDYTQDPIETETTYQSAYYNRLVKAADGIDAHDAVVMEQLKPYTKSDASNIGANLKTYTVGDDGETITETDATADQKKTNKDAWGTALGADTFSEGTPEKATDASTSDQLVTGKTLYNYDAPVAETGKKLNYVSANNTTGQNLSALDAQVADNASKLNDKTHNIKYYSVSDNAPTLGFDSYSNAGNDGAKGRGSLAAGFVTHADGIASTVAGSYSGVINSGDAQGTDLRGAAALSYGTFNVNQNTDTAKEHSGVANSIVGQANMTTDSNAAIIYGAGNMVTNSYRKIDDTNASEIMQAALSKDVKKLGEALQKAVPKSGAQVMVMGGGNVVDKAYMTQVTGVGNTVTGADSTYSKGTSTQYNFVDGFQNELTNGKHDYIIGSNNKVSGESIDKNQSNIVFGDNHKLTNQKNNVIIGSSDTADDETTASDVVAIGHNAKVSAEGGVAIGSGSEATVTGKSTEGYDPATGQNSTKTTAAWQATNAAVSIGTSDGTVTRQINGVAAGTNDTDAVNVAQLKKLEGMKANVDASNIGANLKGSDGKTAASASDITANEDAWGTAIGTGAIASTSGQLVTGKTVYSEVRPTADGTYIKTANTTAANLTALDTQVGRNTTNISNLQNGEGFTDKGNTYIKNLAKGSIGMENGSHTTVSHRDANGVETYKVDVNVDGKVESGNKGIVDGGAVYSAIQDVKNQTSADLANKANVDASNLTPNNVTKWQEKLGNGKVESGNTGLVTGDTVFKAVDTKADRDGSNLTDKEADSFSEKIARGEVKAGENRAVSGDAVSQAISKVTGDMNTKLDGKANTSLDNITKDGQTVIKKLSQDAVQVKAGDDHITVDAKTDETTGNKTYTISAKDGKVASGDTGLISGGTLYNEVHVDKDGSYIKSGNTVGNNLSALDTGLKNTSSLIHTNTSGDTIHIGETSKATKVDVSSTDANGNKNGRVVTGVVTDAKDANSAANVGYVNGVTAANTQQIYRDMSNAYSRLDTNINRAAAGSNALAALHPLDFDPADKASFAVGYGHYRNANAAAVGAFYQPNANTMVNMGISLGNGDPGFNAGVSFKIGKGSAYNGVSKAEMAQTIHDQATEISAIKADDAAKDKRIDALEKENQEMKKQIQEILARLNG